MLVFAACVVAQQAWTTDFGMDEHLVGNHRIVVEVDPGGAADRAGIRVGDEILADPGLITLKPPWTEREIYAWNLGLGRAIATRHAPMQIARDGDVLDVDVHADPPPNAAAALRQLRRMAPQLPTAFAFLAMALLLARRARRGDPAWTLSLSFAAFGPCWLINWSAPAWPAWLRLSWSAIDCFGSMVGVLYLARFAWSFPTESWLARAPKLRASVAAAGIAAAALSYLDVLQVVPLPRPLRGHHLLMIGDCLLALSVLAGFAWQRRHAQGPVAKRQATVLIASVALGVLAPIFAVVLPQMVFGKNSPLLYQLLFPAPMLIPLGIAVAVSRYRLFGLDELARSSVPYVVAVATALMVGVAVILGIDVVVEWNPGTTSRFGHWLGLLAAVAAAEPLRRALQRLIDRSFARDRAAFSKQCAGLAAAVAASPDSAAICAAVERHLDASPVSLLRLREIAPDASLPRIRALLEREGALRTVELPVPAVVDALLGRGFELVAWLSDAGGDASTSELLALRSPLAVRAISRTERDALALVGRVIGATLAQRAAATALDREVARAEDERRHIAMELHDGLGATLTTARLVARRLRQSADGADAGALDSLDAALGEGLGDLRASLWSLDPAQTSWEDLVARLSRQGSDACAAAGAKFELHAERLSDASPSPALRLAILRIVQEAVSNALKHGSPRQVRVVLSEHEDRLSLTIEDDGIGLPDPGSAEVSAGRGLGNMRRRAASLSGELRLRPRTGGGTRVEALLPGLATLAGEAPR